MEDYKEMCAQIAEICGDYAKIGEERVKLEVNKYIAEQTLNDEQLALLWGQMLEDINLGEGWTRRDVITIMQACGVLTTTLFEDEEEEPRPVTPPSIIHL